MPAVLLGVCYWVLFGQPGVGQGCWLERQVLIQGQLLSGMAWACGLQSLARGSMVMEPFVPHERCLSSLPLLGPCLLFAEARLGMRRPVG